MKWLREHGLVSSYADYEDLPVEVLEQARVLMNAEADAQEQMRHG